MLKKLNLIFFFILIFFEKNLSLAEPIIVISPGKSVQSLGAVGSNVAVINEETINNSSEFFLGDIINNHSTGINMFQSGGPGTTMGIQLRGLEKRYSSVYIDGVKMSDPSSPDNSFYFQNILKNSIEKVEILKGNQSTLYGSSAIGGVIHIFTKKGYKNQKPNLTLNLGSNNSKSTDITIGGEKNKINYFLGISKFSTDGISARNDDAENDKYKNISLINNLKYNFNNNLDISSSFRYTLANSNYDSISKSISDLNNKSNDVEASYSILITKKSKKQKNSFNYNKTYIERKTMAPENEKQNYFGYRDSFGWLGEYNFNLDNRIVYGAELEIDSARYIGDYAPSATNWRKIFNDKEADENIFSQYFDFQIRPFEKLYTTIGLRNDMHSTSGNAVSGRNTIAYKINNLTTLKTSYGSGVRFPALYDLHYADGNTNLSGGGSYPDDGYLGLKGEDLKAERSNSFDIGLETLFSGLNLGININYFNIEQKNSLVGDSRNNWKIQNLSGVNTSKGLEFSLNWKPLNKFNTILNYTLNKTYDANTCNSEIVNFRGCNLISSKIGDAKVRTPRNTMNLIIEHNPNNRIKNNINFKFTDEVRDFGDVNNNFQDVILKDYNTVDFSSIYRIANNRNLEFQAINIFNRNYEKANGYSSLGRSFFLTLKTVY